MSRPNNEGHRANGAPAIQNQIQPLYSANDGGTRKALADSTYLAGAACYCRPAESCSTCAAYRVIFEEVADRRAKRTEQAIHMRPISLAQHCGASPRRPVRELPRRLPFDLDALADAVALRLRRSA